MTTVDEIKNKYCTDKFLDQLSGKKLEKYGTKEAQAKSDQRLNRITPGETVSSGAYAVHKAINQSKKLFEGTFAGLDKAGLVGTKAKIKQILQTMTSLSEYVRKETAMRHKQTENL